MSNLKREGKMMFILLGVLFVSFFSVRQSKASVVMCHSFTCANNIRGCCVRQKIIVYDNTVVGLCLYHTDNMSKRILEPMGKVVERGKPNSNIVNKIVRADEDKRDSELIKNSKAFTLWMRKHVKN